MAMYPVTIQTINQTTEAWTTYMTAHATKVNHARSAENAKAGAEQYKHRLTFEIMWRPALEAVAHTPQLYRLVYRGRTYDIEDYDDYMETHRTVHLIGVAYGP